MQNVWHKSHNLDHCLDPTNLSGLSTELPVQFSDFVDKILVNPEPEFSQWYSGIFLNKVLS